VLVNVPRTVGQRRSSGGGSFLDSAGVMILMTGERRSPGERLLAIRIGALIRPLARVNASMPCQRAGVTEGLDTAS
jgi:hypothetical protein